MQLYSRCSNIIFVETSKRKLSIVFKVQLYSRRNYIRGNTVGRYVGTVGR